MSFTPNMTIEEIMEQDKKRGNENSDKLDTWPKDDHPHSSGTSTLKSFLKELALKKAYEDDPDMEDVSKPLPKKSKRKGESEFQHKIRQWSDEVKERPGRFPGGQKQAIAIAAEQSGQAKKGVEGLFDVSKAEVEVEGDEAEIEGVKEVELEMEKALSTRSFHIPRPVGIHDPFDVYRSATTQTTRRFSKLSGGSIAPAVHDTFDQVAEDEKYKTQGVTYKSCSSHGVIHRSDLKCGMCVTLSKSHPSCQKCGEGLVKMVGGYKCASCG